MIKKTSKVQSYKIISVGGSIIIPQTGFDVDFLKKFCALILDEVKKGQKFILVIGGGATARNYQAAGAAMDFSDTDLDWAGIYATMLNAAFVRLMFGKYAHEDVISDPTKKIKTIKPVIIASGWVPGCSTDRDAVLLAKTYGAKEVVNLSNVDYVYDSDPRSNPSAKKFVELNWQEFRKIVGSKWTPGANVPFDPAAAELAEKLKLTVKFVKGTDLERVGNVLTGQAFGGTVIG